MSSVHRFIGSRALALIGTCDRCLGESIYNFERTSRVMPMRFDNPVILTAVGLIVLVGIVASAAHFFAPEARLGRRRRRNNYRVVSKAKRPIVTLNARTKK